MISALIVEDQNESLDHLKSLLTKYCPDISLIEEAKNLSQAREKISLYNPDILFLDIYLPDGKCFELLQQIHPIRSKIIFTTAFDKFGIEAIKFSALDYLLKPIDPIELLEAIRKFRDSHLNNLEVLKIKTLLENHEADYQNKKIAISTFSKIHILKVSDIIHVESQSNYSNFHLANDTEVLSTKTLKEQAELLTPFNFVRIHRSHLVNFNYITEYEKLEGGLVVLSNGKKLPVSYYKKKHLMEHLNNL